MSDYRYWKLYINSEHRDSGSNTKFHVNIAREIRRVESVGVTDIVMPHALPNVIMNRNDVLVVNGTTLQIPEDAYDPDTLLAAMQNLTDSAGMNLSWSKDDVDRTFSVSSTTADVYTVDGTALNLFGFTAGQVANNVAANDPAARRWVTASSWNLRSPITSITIGMRNDGLKILGTKTNKDMAKRNDQFLRSIPVDVAYGEMIKFKEPLQKYDFVTVAGRENVNDVNGLPITRVSDLKTLTPILKFELLDQDGDPFSMAANVNISFTIVLRTL